MPTRRTLGPLTRDDAPAVVAVVIGAVLVLADLGRWLSGPFLVAALLSAVGGVLVWRRPGPAAGSAPRYQPLRVAVGVSLVLVGGIVTVAAVSDVRTIGRSLAGAAVVLTGVVLMLGPGLARLVRDLTRERRERIRSQERAEVAAHLHDGVLQTLAIIQKRADDGREVKALARRQERELRAWLYGEPTPETPATVAGLLRRELDDVEDRHGVRVEAVLVGDADLDDTGRALVAAGREAVTNAARHAGVDLVDVYLEVEPDGISLFVRDRGRGFDPAAVAADRRGLQESVVGRVTRHGGRAEVRSSPGAGTEVELQVPRTASGARYPEEPPAAGDNHQ